MIARSPDDLQLHADCELSRLPATVPFSLSRRLEEKDTRASLLFGRAFENALAALFRREDPGAALFREWSAYQDRELDYSRGDSWRKHV